jgi:hypothetical protein
LKIRSYNRELRSCTAQFLDVFNNIVIDRRDNDDAVQQLVNVTAVFGNRGRILKSLENKNKTLKLPIIAVTMGSITRDASRVADPKRGILSQNGPNWNYNKFAGIPIDITYNLSALTKYQEDMDQIYCNFAVFFNPDIFVVWPNPKHKSENIKSQVVWHGDFSIKTPDEVTDETPWRVSAEASFTYKTWIFPGMDEIVDSQAGRIHKINFTPSLIPFGDDGYMMDRWYAVPTGMSFTEYRSNIFQGLIKMDLANMENGQADWDLLKMQLGGPGGATSGYWSEVTGFLKNDPQWGSLSSHVSGNPHFIVKEDSEMVIINDIGYLADGMKDVNFKYILGL